MKIETENFLNADEFFMQKVLNLAELGKRETNPNPMVGCVIVKNNSIIGQGWHHKAGMPHAEIEAINNALESGNDVRGSCLYVNLEPCSHYGKTPPCAERLVKEGISRVVIGMKDPNELVNGKGIKILRDSGIEVIENCLEKESKWLNRGFIMAHKHKRSWVNLKVASSLDGKIALKNGESKWLTGIQARTEAHSMRAENDAVLVGVGTVLKDNPELNVRLVKGKNPLRIVLDKSLLTPPDSKVVTGEGSCLIFTGDGPFERRKKILEDAGAKVIKLPNEKYKNLRTGEIGEIPLNNVLEYLVNEEGIFNLMVEGGAGVLNSFIKGGYADYISIFFAPKILGEGLSFGTGMVLKSMSESVDLKDIKSKILGEDVLIEGRFKCSPDL